MSAAGVDGDGRRGSDELVRCRTSASTSGSDSASVVSAIAKQLLRVRRRPRVTRRPRHPTWRNAATSCSPRGTRSLPRHAPPCSGKSACWCGLRPRLLGHLLRLRVRCHAPASAGNRASSRRFRARTRDELSRAGLARHRGRGAHRSHGTRSRQWTMTSSTSTWPRR